VSNLEKENIVLNNVKSDTNQLWKNPFHFPLSSIFVTDNYGYNRATVGEKILHKGTDFRAQEGTEVRAMNKGIVKIARIFTVYGNTVVIDHGKGILTFYMHLSKLLVKEGDMVEEGMVIGKSGMTGYAEAPHLHISVRINGISIDPMTFMGFFEEKKQPIQ
jgi:murein DD-endopeptidase MepM/ murein hydrolase activator NlpD